jgi:uncharacterized protein YndB with AHSA1/START domain
MFREILLAEEYRHPPEKVWRLLTDSAALERWLMPNDFVPEVQQAFTMTTAPRPGFDGIIRCKVLELDPPRRMRWSWRAGSIDSTVTFELSPTENGTRLTLRHDGFKGLSSIIPWLILRHGWKEKLRAKVAGLLEAERQSTLTSTLPRSQA